MLRINIGDCFREKEIEKPLTPFSTITNNSRLSQAEQVFWTWLYIVHRATQWNQFKMLRKNATKSQSQVVVKNSSVCPAISQGLGRFPVMDFFTIYNLLGSLFYFKKASIKSLSSS